MTALDVFLILYLQTARLPLARGADHHAARRHRRLLRRADRAGRSGVGRGDPRLRADHRDRDATRTCSISRMGILGATVMPHNLYLHSAIVQTRAYGDTPPREARGAEVRHHRFHRGADVRAADQRLDPDPGGGDLPQGRARPTWPSSARRSAAARRCSGSAIAPTLFGIALLCCGLNSTVTATLAGQIVMEGFLNIRLPPWLRRLVTRAIAIVPAAVVTIFYGESGTAQAADPDAGDPEPAAALRRRAAGHVHRRPRQDGRAGGAALADGVRGRDRGRHHRAQHQAAGRFRARISRSTGVPQTLIVGWRQSRTR